MLKYTFGYTFKMTKKEIDVAPAKENINPNNSEN